MAEVVAETGLAPSTVRYYIATGLLPPGRRAGSHRHLYDERHLESLRLIRLLKERRHLSVESIRKILPELLQLPADGAFRPEMWERLVEARQASSAAVSGASRLLEAGIEAFARYGYAEVRVEDVCQAAKLAKGSFYRHYGSKEELYFAAAREAGRRAGASFEEKATELPGEGGPLSYEDALGAMASAIEPSLSLFLDLMALSAQRRPGHGRVLREVFSHLHRLARARLCEEAVDRSEELLERALVGGIRRVIVSPSELLPGESAL